MNQDLMVSILETICLKKNKRWGIGKKLDGYADVGTHWISLFFKRSEIVYFNSFGVENVHEEIKEFLGIKSIKPNIFRVQANN